MTRKQKEKIVRQLVWNMIRESAYHAQSRVTEAIKSGAINIDEYDFEHAPYVLPKTITAALLQAEIRPLLGKGTKYEKQVKKDIKNLLHFL